MMRLRFTLFFAAIVTVVSPLSSSWAQTSKAHIVVDVTTRKILMARNHEEKLPVASLTKIVTACIVLDWMESTNGDPNQLLTIPASAAGMGGSNPLGMQPGDQVTIRDLRFLALMASDNVAAQTLAENLGNDMWRRDGGRAKSGVDFFVGQMNALAKAQQMEKTRFYNPHGLDHEKPRGYSTAADMARITLYALQKPSFNFIVSQKEREVAYLRGGQKYAFRIYNTNQLVGQGEINGVKTGRTTLAGDCLVLSAQRDDKIEMLEENRYLRTPYHLVVVTLNSSDRFGQGRKLVNDGFIAYENWMAAGRPVDKGGILVMPKAPAPPPRPLSPDGPPG